MTPLRWCVLICFVSLCVMGYYEPGPLPGQSDASYILNGGGPTPWQGFIATIVFGVTAGIAVAAFLMREPKQ